MGKMLGVRLPDNIHRKFEILASQNNETIHQLAKKCLIEWIEVLFTSRNLNMIIFPKKSLLKMLEIQDAEQKQILSIEIAHNIVEYFEFLFTTHISVMKPSELFQIIGKFLGSGGMLWFEHTEFLPLEKVSNYWQFNATHNSTKLWSEFCFSVLSHIIKDYFKGKIQEKSIILGENSLSVQFTTKQ